MTENEAKIKITTLRETIELLEKEILKLENEIVTPFAGTVTQVCVNKGDTANPGQVLIVVA